MIEQLQETEKARQEMKLQAMQVAFEKAQAAKHNCDYEQLKTNLDKQEAEVGSRYLVGFSADWAVWQESWQAAQEQVLRDIYQSQVVCAIESTVQDQMDASGVQEPLHRLDGEKIVDAIIEKLDSSKLSETHVLVEKNTIQAIHQSCENALDMAAVWAKDAALCTIRDEVELLQK